MKRHMIFSLQSNNVKTLVLGGPKGNATVVGTADSFEKSCLSLKKLFHDLRFQKLSGLWVHRMIGTFLPCSLTGLSRVSPLFN